MWSLAGRDATPETEKARSEVRLRTGQTEVQRDNPKQLARYILT